MNWDHAKDQSLFGQCVVHSSADVLVPARGLNGTASDNLDTTCCPGA